MDLVSELRDRNMKSDLGDNLCARAAAEIERLRDALEFVKSDPCFRNLGTVTHDTVTDALGLTNILEESH